MRYVAAYVAVVAFALTACSAEVEPERTQPVTPESTSVLLPVPTDPTISFSV